MDNQENAASSFKEKSTVPAFKILAFIFFFGQAYYYYLGIIYFREKMDAYGFKAASLDGPISEVYVHSWDAIKMLILSVDKCKISSDFTNFLLTLYCVCACVFVVYFFCFFIKDRLMRCSKLGGLKSYISKSKSSLSDFYSNITQPSIFNVSISKAFIFLFAAPPIIMALYALCILIILLPLLCIFVLLYIPDAAGVKYVQLHFKNEGEVCRIVSDKESAAIGKSKRCDKIRFFIDKEAYQCTGKTIHSDKKNYYFLTNDRALTIDSKTMNLVIENSYLGDSAKTKEVKIDNPEYKDFKWCSPIEQKKKHVNL